MYSVHACLQQLHMHVAHCIQLSNTCILIDTHPLCLSLSLTLSSPPPPKKNGLSTCISSLPLSLTCTVIHGYQLCQGEQAVSLTSCTLGESADTRNTFYVVGTAFVDVGEKEPTQGRVLVFQVTDSKHKIE